MTAHCSWCGRVKPPYENHHIAGESNYPAWFARTCKGCHTILTALQYTRRTPLGKSDIKTDEIRRQAIYQGLSDAMELACEYAGQTPASIVASTVVSRLLKHDPDPMTGREFSVDGSYPKIKVKNPVRVATGPMCGENFQRVVGAMCSVMAFVLEESKGLSNELAVMLRRLEGQLMIGRGIGSIPKADFLVALSTCDETIIRDRLSKVAAEMGIQL